MDVDLGCSSYLYLAALLELKGRGCREGGAVLVGAAPLAALLLVYTIIVQLIY